MRNIIILFLIFLLIFIFIIYPIFNISTKTYEVKKDKLPEPFNNYKIVQVSDLYLKASDKLSKLQDAISKSNPDLVVFTGNTFTKEDSKYYENFMKMKDEISESLLFYIVKGQTESNLDDQYLLDLSNKMKNHGIYFLDDEKINLNKGGQTITIQAVRPKLEDYDLGEYKVKIDKDIRLSDKEFNLILSHNPSYADELSQKGADLILSGARNGGWIRIPFVGGLDYPVTSRYKEGDYIIDNSLLIVSRGTGIKEGKFRLFNNKEINEIILKR